MVYLNGVGLTGNQYFGIHRNTIELLTELDKLVAPDDFSVVIPSNKEINHVFKNIKIIKTGIAKESKISRFVWNNFTFKQFVKKKRGATIDMLLVLPYSGYDAVFIYDCITEMFPQNCNSFKKKISRLLYIKRVRKNLRKCKIVFTDSESARNDISFYYKYPIERIHVIPCAWQHFLRVKKDESIIKKLGLTGKLFLFSLGSRFYHKNFKWVVEAAKQNKKYIFVVSGSSAINSSDGFIEKDKIGNLIFTGYLEDSQVKSLMSHCLAFIQPSMYEGFGIPPMEAMSAGADCIVSNKGSLPEVYKKSVHYIDPYNYTDINIESILSSPKDDNNRILDNYSWEKSARIFYEVLEKEFK